MLNVYRLNSSGFSNFVNTGKGRLVMSFSDLVIFRPKSYWKRFRMRFLFNISVATLFCMVTVCLVNGGDIYFCFFEIKYVVGKCKDYRNYLQLKEWTIPLENICRW